MRNKKELNQFFNKITKHGNSSRFHVFKKYELLNKTYRSYINNRNEEKKEPIRDQITIGKIIRISFIFLSSTLLLLTGFYLFALLQNEKISFAYSNTNINNAIQIGLILQALLILFMWSLYNYLIINDKDNKIITIGLTAIKTTLAYKGMLLIKKVESAINQVKELKINEIDINVMDYKIKMYYRWNKHEIKEYINNLIENFEKTNNTKLTVNEWKEIKLMQSYHPTNMEKNVIYLNEILEKKLETNKPIKIDTWENWIYENIIQVKDFVADLFTEKYYYLGYFITASIAMYIYVRTNESTAQDIKERLTNMEKRMNGDHLEHIYAKVTNDDRFLNRLTNKVIRQKAIPSVGKNKSIIEEIVDSHKSHEKVIDAVYKDLRKFQNGQKDIALKLSDLIQKTEYLDIEKKSMQDQINELIRRSKSILINSKEIIEKT